MPNLILLERVMIKGSPHTNKRSPTKVTYLHLSTMVWGMERKSGSTLVGFCLAQNFPTDLGLQV